MECLLQRSGNERAVLSAYGEGGVSGSEDAVHFRGSFVVDSIGNSFSVDIHFGNFQVASFGLDTSVLGEF